jgi:hypothetical protein
VSQSPPPELTKAQWVVLNGLSDGPEPIESAFLDLRDARFKLPAEAVLEIAFALYAGGFVVLTQRPPGQSAAERRLAPTSAREVVGDLEAEFRAFAARGDWRRRPPAPADDDDPEPATVSIGIYLEQTPAGHAEVAHPRYRRYWAR